MRAKEIYFGLLKRWESECSDGPWLESLKKQYNIVLTNGQEIGSS